MQEIDFTSTILKDNISSLAVVAAKPGDGNTTATIGLALALRHYARKRKPVLAVDMVGTGDMAALLEDREAADYPQGLAPSCQQLRGSTLILDDVLFFSPEAAELERVKLHRQLAALWVSALVAVHDFVLFDLPAYNQNPGFAVFMRALGGAIITLNCRTSRWEVAQDMKERLDKSNVNVIGVILNRRSYPVPAAIQTLL